MSRVVIAMSGGVDSSVAAALLVEQGHDVIGMMLRLWSEPGKEESNRCCTPDAMATARRISSRLGIPFYAVDAKQVFRETVVKFFLEGYAQGSTPNPCLICNRDIRWRFLLTQALALGADYLATGHYARLMQSPSGEYSLLRAVDRHKDQSYILHILGQYELAHTLFPIGGYIKSEVRALANKYGLPVASRPDSQDLCFLAGEDYRNFLRRNSPDTLKPGSIFNSEGVHLGEHQGLPLYTIGQRKGLGLSSLEPLYVLNKDIARNALVVGYREELGHQVLIARNVNWISGFPPSAPFRAQVKIRYKAEDAWATVSPLEDAKVEIVFDESLRDITPGQAAVFFHEETCLGGGIIV